MRRNKSDEFLKFIPVINLALIFSLFMMNILFPSTNKAVFLGSNKTSENAKELKSMFCSFTFDLYKKGVVSEEFFHKEAKSFIERNKTAEYKTEGIEHVYSQMISEDACKVIFRRKKGFSGLNVVFTRGGDFGYHITSIIPIKNLTIDDVRSYL